ncbi:MAG TPA: thiamine pyrophosphate-dependent enzyme [Candidatus Omnitrophota bacterium]|nr:thiamine pyrophosphate-dependent enzyme [Candidatus Omnitrophota bacterium]
MLTKQDLENFEKEIADIFATGVIRGPVHLRAGREERLIKIFKDHGIGPDDYVFGHWDAHELALLKGVPRDQVKQAILEGRSISLCFPEYHVFCSGIVGSLMGAAAGVAWALKRDGKKGKVYIFCGEMSAETGIFHEAVKYACHFDLPVTYVVCDNGLSVMTDTRAVWGSPDPWFKDTKFEKKIIYFKYKNTYPHSGLGWKIKF